jgi:hypothetical protein
VCASAIPDAIGWTPWGVSIMVECKVSVGDFNADKRKPSHRAGRIPGALRYYMTPPGLLKAENVKGNWGLLEAGAKVRVIKHATQVTPCLETETRILVAEMRRVVGGYRRAENLPVIT